MSQESPEGGTEQGRIKQACSSESHVISTMSQVRTRNSGMSWCAARQCATNRRRSHGPNAALERRVCFQNDARGKLPSNPMRGTRFVVPLPRHRSEAMGVFRRLP
jgi:hypothetical protein